MSKTETEILTISTTLMPTKTVMPETMILSVLILITVIQILTTSKTTVQTTMTSTALIMSSYVIIENAVKVIISFKNMVNLLCILFNSFNNLTQISVEENSNTLISEQNNIMLHLNITYVINAINI